MFRGSSFHNMDAKGRVAIPSRFQPDIVADSSGLLMLTCLDRCVLAYTLHEWQKIEVRIQSLTEKGEQIRRFRRVFVGGACECPLDGQSRILVPPTLRQYAELKKEIVLVGVIDHFEIWSRPRWDEEQELLQADLQQETLRHEIARLGL